MYETVRVDREGEVAVVRMHRPDVLNALNHALRDELAAALEAANADVGVRAVVLTGAPVRTFGVGLDMAVSTGLDAGNVEAWLRGVQRLFGAIRGMDKPVVAAVNGAAIGLGLQTALHCDVRIGQPGVRMSQPEINAGVPSVLGHMILVPLMGLARTIEFSLSCRQIDAAEALSFGLLHEVVPAERLMDRALEVARDLGARPPVAMRLTKRRMRETTQAAFDDAFDACIRLQREGYASGEPQRLAQAFLDRRRKG